ncbi:glycosyltransferase family A protein [Fictibacillus nanhaiensis]|uniref:glycosyltransferase family A protein n=1 Tax=Fictibacillus nanhaiensis TaxID=742169 RepID=UPI002E1F2D58|nr:glycosyltransferase family A protein [Fictibacillus nanhaiensis]
MDKVTIIIPFYNCTYINQAIESALNQSYKNIEIIVVNDGSTIHNEKVSAYLTKIRYFEKKNGGTASALNMGIKHATGDYFAWLSSDDIFHPEKIEKQLHFMKTVRAEATYSNFYLINELSHIISSPQGVGYQTEADFLKRMSRGCVINGCTVMLKMDVFREFGLFDETLLYTQDYDYWLRILSRYNFVYYPEPLVNYRIHKNMGTKQHKLEIRKELVITTKKHRFKMNELIKNALQK